MSVVLRRFSLSFSLVSLMSVPLSAQSLTMTDSAPQRARAVMIEPGVALRHRAMAPLPLVGDAAWRTASAPAPAPVPEGFASSGFAQFMSSPAGRVLRVVAGAGMIAGGIAADSDLGTGIAVAGAVPLLAGALDFCILSPLFGGPLSGKAIRAAKP